MKQLLKELDDRLLAAHRYDTGLFESLAELQRDSGLLHGDRPLCPFLRPYFLGLTRYRDVQRASRLLNSAFETLARAALDQPKIMDELGLTEKERRWARLPTGYDCISVNSRLDTFLSADGFAFLEYNAENPAGIGDQSALEALFRKVPEVAEFLGRHPHHFPQPQVVLLKALDATYREFGGRKERPSIAIVDWKDVATGSEFLILREHFESNGYPTRICDPEHLEYDGQALRNEDFVIDIFFKRVIIHEFLERYEESHPLYRAIEDGSVCMANSFRSKIPHKKSSFAILSDDRFCRLFSDDELDIIRRHIPWTRRVVEGTTEWRGEPVDLLELVRRERSQFVLKPNDDYGGKGIAIGWESTESEWDSAIENALDSDFVVQERVIVDKTSIPMVSDAELRCESLLVDFDPFLFRGSVEGGMVRLSDRSLVNVTQGGGETALVILNDY